MYVTGCYELSVCCWVRTSPKPYGNASVTNHFDNLSSVGILEYLEHVWREFFFFISERLFPGALPISIRSSVSAVLLACGYSG